MSSATPMSKACCDNDLAFVENYISSLPSDQVYDAINYGDPHLGRDTPLIIAAQYGRSEIVSFLLKNGARKDFTNNYGVTAYEQTKRKLTNFMDILAGGISHTGRDLTGICTDDNRHNVVLKRDNVTKVLEMLEAHTDPEHVCIVCRKPDNIRRCSRCHGPQYCGRACQLVVWKRGHKSVCLVQADTCYQTR